VYNAAKDGIATAAEDSTRDLMWPFLDMAEGAADIGGDYTDALMQNGKLQRDAQEAWMWQLQNDSNGGPLKEHPR
jgi:hypothetical protein